MRGCTPRPTHHQSSPTGLISTSIYLPALCWLRSCQHFHCSFFLYILISSGTASSHTELSAWVVCYLPRHQLLFWLVLWSQSCTGLSDSPSPSLYFPHWVLFIFAHNFTKHRIFGLVSPPPQKTQALCTDKHNSSQPTKNWKTMIRPYTLLTRICSKFFNVLDTVFISSTALCKNTWRLFITNNDR